MISIQKNFLFIHVPKTGGNSIQNLLRNYSEDDIVIQGRQDGVERFDVRNSRYNTTKHSTLSQYKAVLDANTYRSLFKFAAIRNPWDRMISLYFSPHTSITEWDRGKFLKLVKRAPTLRHHTCETSFFERGLAKLGVYRTRGKIDSDIDFLIRFEWLSDDFKSVCERLNIPLSPLPKRNRSDHEHYSKYYDEELKEIVRQKYAEEIEFGNYSFENA